MPTRSRRSFALTSGQRLRAARLAHGFTQEELAHASGLAQETISALERDYRKGTATSWRALARALQVTITSLADEVA